MSDLDELERQLRQAFPAKFRDVTKPRRDWTRGVRVDAPEVSQEISRAHVQKLLQMGRKSQETEEAE